MSVLSLFHALDKPVRPSQEFRLNELEYVISHADAPPEATGEWQRITSVVEVPETPYASVWFRMDVAQRLDRNHANALYIARAFANVQVWLDEDLQYTAAPIEEPLALFQTPLLIPLGNFDPSADRVMLHIRLTKAWGYYRPSAIYLAPSGELTTAFERRYWQVQTLPKLIIAVTLTMVALIGGLYLMRPKDSAYGWYALYMLLWTAHTAHALVDRIPIDHEVWFALTYLCLVWVVCEVIFINRYFGFHMPRIERTIAVVTVLLAIAVLLPALLGSTYGSDAVTHVLWLPWMILLALFVFVQCFMAVRQRWSIDSLGLLLISSIFVVISVRDAWFDFFGGLPGTMYYLQFIVLAPLFFFGFLLLRRHVRALRLSENLNTELEKRVAAKAEQLEQTYVKLTEEEKKREVAEERARLMRDMHDGLGGQLVHALSLTEKTEDRPDLKQALQYALTDLRLIVDSLAPAEDGFGPLLANFRHRVSKSVARAGIDLDWALSGVQDVKLRADQSLALLRIIQEATTNALRHSECNRISISVTNGGDAVTAEVRDDGKGIGSSRHGRGLDNMLIRAESMSGELSIASDAGGTSVLCSIPVGDAIAAQS